uniref:histidine kinase n=3 Tax=Triticinae TaxID=1648030 RepID=A0A3B6DKC6_WHEAT
MENPGKDHEDALKDVEFREQPGRVDLNRLLEIANTEKGTFQMQSFVKQWEYKRANTARLLNEELGRLSQQRKEIEQKKQQMLEEGERHNALKCSSQESSDLSHDQELEDDAEYDTVSYWKRRALRSEKAHEADLQRERSLEEKLEEYMKKFQPETPTEEFSAMLKRADYFLHLILQSAPIVIAHQDAELRYRYIFNHFPTLADEDVIGKTDHEILSEEGIDEMNKVKREVMAKGIPTKREFVFDTPLFGPKTFVVYIEPVFTKSGETIGVNYVAMDITDQVKTREKMTDIRVREAVQKAKETEHSKSLNITEETTQAQQMLATMSHEIRSPLSGVLSIAKILATTKLDQEQHQLLEAMLSSGNAVLQSINDILGLSKVESGIMKLQPAIFRPREVVKHVLQNASSFMKKELTLEGCIDDDVPSEVIADAQKIQEILTNLISFSNAVKFTHEGKVGINFNIVDKQQLECKIEHTRPHSASPVNTATEYYAAWPSHSEKMPRVAQTVKMLIRVAFHQMKIVRRKLFGSASMFMTLEWGYQRSHYRFRSRGIWMPMMTIQQNMAGQGLALLSASSWWT